MLFTPPIFDKAHNETLDMAMSIGVLGVAVFWWVLVSAVRAGKLALGVADPRRGFAAGCLAAVGGYWVDVPWHFRGVRVWPVFWIGMGARRGMGLRHAG